MNSQGATPEAIRQRWGLAAPANRGPRARFGLDDVVGAAVHVADRQGFDAVTLATVARHLGLATTALYRYVDSKETLAELMVDAAIGEPPAATGARELHRLVDALWGRYAAHPWLATFPLARAPRCPNAFAWLARLRSAAAEHGAADPLGVALDVDILTRGYAASAGAARSPAISDEVAGEIARRHPGLGAAGSRPTTTKQDLDAAVARLIGE